MYKLAIVDDENDILQLLGRFLQRDFEVTTYSNPVNSLNDILNNNFDLVLCDIMMPQIDGIELLQKVRNADNETKFIMMTAFDTMDRALAAHKYGATNYIKKPFESLEVVKEKILTELSYN
jgi:DNA-binding NtrC family response regulator